MDDRRDEIRVDDSAEEMEMENQLRELTEEDVQVPPSLEPEAIEKMLEDKKKEKRRRYIWKYAGIAAAASLCLAVGIAYAAGNKDALSADKTDENAEQTVVEQTVAEQSLVLAADYDQLYDYIQAGQKQSAKMMRGYSESASDMAVYESLDTESKSSFAAAGAADESGAAQSYSGDYSDTNVREEGVKEADIVKTDGENLYVLNGQKVDIVGITSQEMEPLAQIQMEDGYYVSEIYAEDDRLAILYTKSEYEASLEESDGYYRDYTCTDVYDISSPASPQKLGTISQSGYYSTMRVRDGYVYVISSFYADAMAPRSDRSAYVPAVQGEILDSSQIYMPEGTTGSQYTVISAFALNDPTQKTDSKAVFGIAGMCYVSTENIYITEAYYGTADVAQTSIRKISYHDGKLDGVAQTKVDGTLKDSFSIDEYEGYLRMVVTIEPSGTNNGIMPLAGEETVVEETEEAVMTNSLYVLDSGLKTVGEINDLAEEERVYSARFMGDTGYFVTYRQVDPLFSVDLTDPQHPEIIGELKIPGFSEYLHPYGDGRLLGIGMDVDEEGVTTAGVKLSMFDISDPADVQEISKYTLEDIYGTDAAYDYKAVFADVQKNLFGFITYGDTTEYKMFTYDETNGFAEVFSREMMTVGRVRGLYAGDRFYLVAGNTVESYTLDGFEKVDDIVL